MCYSYGKICMYIKVYKSSKMSYEGIMEMIFMVGG